MFPLCCLLTFDSEIVTSLIQSNFHYVSHNITLTQFSNFSSRPWRNLPPAWVIHMATRRPAHNMPIHMNFVYGLKRPQVHVDRRVVGWSAGGHVDHPCWWQISPWPARKSLTNVFPKLFCWVMANHPVARCRRHFIIMRHHVWCELQPVFVVQGITLHNAYLILSIFRVLFNDFRLTGISGSDSEGGKLPRGHTLVISWEGWEDVGRGRYSSRTAQDDECSYKFASTANKTSARSPKSRVS